MVVEIELVLQAVRQIKDTNDELISTLIIFVIYSEQSLRFSVPLGEVPDLLQQLRVGDGRVEVLALGLHAQLLLHTQVLQNVHGRGERELV